MPSDYVPCLSRPFAWNRDLIAERLLGQIWVLLEERFSIGGILQRPRNETSPLHRLEVLLETARGFKEPSGIQAVCLSG